MTGIIFDVKRYAIHDGPGIRTTIFFKGCPLRCQWCHNPESWEQGPEHSFRVARCLGCGRCIRVCDRGATSRQDDRLTVDRSKCLLCGACVDVCPSGAREIVGRRVTVEEVMAEIERDLIFYEESGGGVTFSGGEPLMQSAFLEELLIRCKAGEIHAALDTTLHAPREVVETISRYVDLHLVDLKHMDAAVHERFTGVSNELILQNLRHLARMEREIIIRMPVIPGVNDDDENIMAAGEFVASLGVVARIDLLPHHAAARGKLARLMERYELLQVDPPANERISTIKRQLETYGHTVKTGG